MYGFDFLFDEENLLSINIYLAIFLKAKYISISDVPFYQQDFNLFILPKYI